MISWKMQKRLEKLGLGAFFALFAAGIAINVAPAVAIAFEGVYCPAGTTVDTGTEAGKRAKSGPVGFAHCVDAAGETRRDITFPVFVSLFAMGTVFSTAGVTIFLRSRGRD